MKDKIITIVIGLIIGVSYHADAQIFTLKSNDLKGQFTNKFMAKTFGCNGENKSPQLSWSDAPAETKSFAITMYDQDAPTGSGWWHWVVFNIPNGAIELIEDAGNLQNSSLPEGSIQGLTDFGTRGYGGPCPPQNDKPHAYVITVYALRVAHLGVEKDATPALVGFMINQHLLAKASLIIYSKR